MRSCMVGGVDEFVDVSDGDGRFGFSLEDRVGVEGGAGLEGSFLALAVMVVRPFSDVPDDEATAALLDKLAGLVSATQGRIIRHQVERTHPLSS